MLYALIFFKERQNMFDKIINRLLKWKLHLTYWGDSDTKVKSSWCVLLLPMTNWKKKKLRRKIYTDKG